MDEKLNAKGQTLREFLAAYDPTQFDRPSVTVDMAVITDSGEVLLIRRGDHPNIGRWALPGGFLDMGETLHQAAARELLEETGIASVPLVPIGMFGEPTRDPRTRILTCAFAAQVKRSELSFSAGDDAAEAALFSISITKKGRVEIPEPQPRGYDVTLPCTACGTPYGRFGTEYALALSGSGSAAGIELCTRIAVDDGGVFVLLGGVKDKEQLAGDHGLVLFHALHSFGMIA
jgi:ADP-ribose pyrophosphatase YjhB (NUDIX family)